MELFDFIKILFKRSDSKGWMNLSSHEKSKYQFMLNRFMSIKYPFNANQMNAVKTTGIGVAETWRNVAERFYNDKVPNFIYTKVSKSKKEDNLLSKVPKESINVWCEKHECGEREFYAMLELNGEELVNELNYITKNFKEKENGQ